LRRLITFWKLKRGAPPFFLSIPPRGQYSPGHLSSPSSYRLAVKVEKERNHAHITKRTASSVFVSVL
jgi:hypothetical protein